MQNKATSTDSAQLLTLASKQVGTPITLIEAGKILSACGLPDLGDYTPQQCEVFIKACTLIK